MPIATWSGRAASRALRRIRSEGRRHATPCCLCGQRINYDLTYPHPQSCSVQHPTRKDKTSDRPAADTPLHRHQP